MKTRFAALLLAAPAALVALDAAPPRSFVLQSSPDLSVSIRQLTTGLSPEQRVRAEHRLRELNPVYQRLSVDESSSSVTLRFDGRAPVKLDLDGRESAWRRESGETFYVSAHQEQDRVVQTYRAKDGERTNQFVLLPDGRLLLKVDVRCAELGRRLQYQVVYEAEK